MPALEGSKTTHENTLLILQPELRYGITSMAEKTIHSYIQRRRAQNRSMTRTSVGVVQPKGFVEVLEGRLQHLQVLVQDHESSIHVSG